MPIALLKFPYDLLEEVFKQCNPHELYNVSLCSQRIRRVLKSRKLRCWKMSFYSSRMINVNCRDVEYGFWKPRSPEDCYMIVRKNTMDIEFLNGEVMDSLEYLIDIFGCSTMESLHFSDYNDLLKFSKIAIDKQLVIEEFHMGKVNNDQEFSDSLELINQLNITKLLDIDYNVRSWSGRVQNRLTRFPNELQINHSSWFSIEQLMTCTSAEIYLTDSSLNNEDLDRFLQKWKRGELPNLQTMIVRCNIFDDEFPVLGMYIPISSKIRSIVDRASVDDTFTMYGVKVRNDDGIEALLQTDYRVIFLVIGPGNTVVEEIDENSDDSDED